MLPDKAFSLLKTAFHVSLVRGFQGSAFNSLGLVQVLFTIA